MKSVVIKRSILINGRKTSVASLENEVLGCIKEIAEHENVAISALVGVINQGP